MRFRFTLEQEKFRSDLQRFLVGYPRANSTDGYDISFSKALAAKGWIGLAWPKEYGGQGLGPIEQMIYTEEMILNQAPRGYHFIGERQVGPSIIRHGSEDQKHSWLPKIMSADVSFALGLSEPGAGSDLASVTTRAERDGDVYRVSGQKIWTSNAHLSDAIWLVVRTDQNAPKHRGISCLLVDIDSPGINIRPLYDMTGEHHFNEVFFDDVRVPADRRVGEENRGWYILAEHLDFERSGIERLIDLQRLFVQAREVAASEGMRFSPAIRSRLAELAIELEVGRLLCYRVAYQQSKGMTPNAEASVSKLFGTEWTQRMAQLATQIAGMSANAHSQGTFGSIAAKAYLNSVSRTIAGGTSEIQRNIIGARGLGLPRA